MPSSALEPRWPPRSPHEALLSSPGGRNRIQRSNGRISPDHSPLKFPMTASQPKSSHQAQTTDMALGEDNGDDEDEETLKLKLQALEAKIRLKQLQQKKRKAAGCEREDETDKTIVAKENRPPTAHRSHPTFRPTVTNTTTSNRVQIAASPQKRPMPVTEKQSPTKVLLGIDKGLTGKDMSLKRRPSQRSRDYDPFQGTKSPSPYIQAMGLSGAPTISSKEFSGKGKTFSERITECRTEERSRRQNIERVRKRQSGGFGISQEDMKAAKDELEARGKDEQISGRPQQGFSREDIRKATCRPNSGLIQRSAAKKTRDAPGGTQAPSKLVWRNPNTEPEVPCMEHRAKHIRESPTRQLSDSPPADAVPDEAKHNTSSSTSDSLFEPFSSTHLSRRVLPHDLLTRTFAQKSILLLPHLLRDVKAPDFSLPSDLEADYVVSAIIASKSNPLTRKDSVRAKSTSSSKSTSTSYSEAVSSEQNGQGGKYMILTLTDLKWTVDLFLFDTAYTRFWKLDPGTLIAILNPSIMPPPPGKTDTGRFSLVLNSSDDTILEIGNARDLGWCSSLCKNGKQCSTWVDKRHTSVCEFHVDRVIEQTRRGRMEVQGMSAPFAPGGREQRTGHFGTGGRRKRRAGEDRDSGPGDDQGSQTGLLREGAQYDRGSKSKYFMAGPAPSPGLFHLHNGGNSAARLLDAEFDPWDRASGSKEERLRKRLADRERENAIAHQLGEAGSGAGREYLRLVNQPGAGSQAGSDRSARPFTGVGHHDSGMPSLDSDPDVNKLDQLRTNKASSVQLSPLRKKRRSSPPLLSNRRGVSAVDGRDRGRGTDQSMSGLSSVKKKTRFITDKGIKEAGRDSLGGGGGVIFNSSRNTETNGNQQSWNHDDDDEEDELEII